MRPRRGNTAHADPAHADPAQPAELFLPDFSAASDASEPFEVDAEALRERIRRASGNPFVRGLSFPRVEVSPRDHSWWAGRERRVARLSFSPMDLETLEYLRALHPPTYRRFLRLLADLLDVGQLELLPLEPPSDSRAGRPHPLRRLRAAWGRREPQRLPQGAR